MNTEDLKREIKDLEIERDFLYEQYFNGNEEKNNIDKIKGLRIADLLEKKRKEFRRICKDNTLKFK